MVFNITRWLRAVDQTASCGVPLLVWNRIQGSLLPLGYLYGEFYLPQVPGEQRVSSHYTFMRDATQGDSGYFCSTGLAHSTSHL